MYTSLVLVALTGSLAASSPNESLAWHDYSHARKSGQTDKKPLAVFVGSGAGGYEKVCKEGNLSAEVQKSLESNYVCVYVDASTPAGQQLAADFAITGGKGLVLSDRTGEKQAFYHDGDLSGADLQRWLTQFADPNVVVNTTTTNSSARISMYPSNAAMGSVIYGSSMGYSSGSVIYGGGCPGGNCRR